MVEMGRLNKPTYLHQIMENAYVSTLGIEDLWLKVASMTLRMIVTRYNHSPASITLFAKVRG